MFPVDSEKLHFIVLLNSLKMLKYLIFKLPHDYLILPQLYKEIQKHYIADKQLLRRKKETITLIPFNSPSKLQLKNFLLFYTNGAFSLQLRWCSNSDIAVILAFCSGRSFIFLPKNGKPFFQYAAR